MPSLEPASGPTRGDAACTYRPPVLGESLKTLEEAETRGTNLPEFLNHGVVTDIVDFDFSETCYSSLSTS